MDPNETFRLMIACAERKEYYEASEYLDALAVWIMNGGFKPKAMSGDYICPLFWIAYNLSVTTRGVH